MSSTGCDVISTLLVAGVEASASKVHAASREIAGAVDGQAATSSQMSASVAEITSTMEELSASSTQIAEYSESVVSIAGRTYDDSLRGSEAMQRLVEKMQRIGRDNQNALNEILELGTRSKEISKIMEIIDTVADQTKLIAFNAALEASSAGEAGKRFGVVAAEIRRLADSVTESTGEITGKVGEIQESINRLVDQLGEGLGRDPARNRGFRRHRRRAPGLGRGRERGVEFGPADQSVHAAAAHRQQPGRGRLARDRDRQLGHGAGGAADCPDRSGHE